MTTPLDIPAMSVKSLTAFILHEGSRAIKVKSGQEQKKNGEGTGNAYCEHDCSLVLRYNRDREERGTAAAIFTAVL